MYNLKRRKKNQKRNISDFCNSYFSLLLDGRSLCRYFLKLNFHAPIGERVITGNELIQSPESLLNTTTKTYNDTNITK